MSFQQIMPRSPFPEAYLYFHGIILSSFVLTTRRDRIGSMSLVLKPSTGLYAAKEYFVDFPLSNDSRDIPQRYFAPGREKPINIH